MLKEITEKAQLGVQFFSVLANTLITQRGELASEETVNRRLAICKNCDRFNPKGNSCTVCTCKLSVLHREFRRNLANKLAHKASSCPLRKWGKELD